MKASSVPLVVVLLALFAVMETGCMYLPKGVSHYDGKNLIADPRKRPFCNAFTGCGRKRSNIPALVDQRESIEDSIGSLLELSAEPAIEDISRQIMSEAKLWEAIQEANMELQRQKTENENAEELPNHSNHHQSSPRKLTAACSFPPCYI